ncbi:MAG TPA: NAD kinase [Saprospiraceae bacterium]|nr:NAD kinase [Saprospiraceae bacterium]
MQVVIYSRRLKEKDIPFVQTLFDELSQMNINAFVYAPYKEQLYGNIQFQNDIGTFDGYMDFKVKKIDFLITLGGDGTMMDATTIVRDSGIPIIGLNLGRLGFLASIEKQRIKEVIQLLKAGRYSIEKRQMLKLNSNYPLFGEIPFALNEFTLIKRDTSSMISIHTYINGAYLNTFWADGLILATPTGSTAYSLSCGGPIIFPDSGNFVLTAVAPHNLNVRSIVLSDTSVITFEVEGRAENFLCTLDSRTETITSAYKLAISKNDFPINLVQLQDARFVETLRSKMGWGKDNRN